MDKKKVAIYARVSTEHEAQLYALENQKDWYEKVLSDHPEWEMVEMYADEGVTGTSAKKRPEFLRMVEDAKQGKFSLIITREVSRFARNTVDTLQYTRLLKRSGVEVFFINDNIRTFDGDGELRLTIMATLAQDESRKTSIRVKAGQEVSMNNGVYYGNGNILGYDRNGDKFVINEEQAETVRMIYSLYLSGMGLNKIKFELERMGRLTATGKSEWYVTNISKVLHNPFYCGIVQYRKSYVNDFLEQKRKLNLGEIDKIEVKGTHEPIISEEEFNAVQRIFQNKLTTMDDCRNVSRGTHVVKRKRSGWGALLECECGHAFNKRAWSRNKSGRTYAYQCYDQKHTGSYQTRINKGLPVDNICQVPMVPEWKIQMMANEVFKTRVNDKEKILEFTESILREHIKTNNDENNEKLIKEKNDEISKLKKRIESLIEMRADNEIDKETFLAKKKETSSRIKEIERELKQLPDEHCGERFDKEDKIKQIMNFLENEVNINDGKNVNPKIVEAFIDKIVVHKDHFDWYVKSFDEGRKPTLYSYSTGCDYIRVGHPDYIEFYRFEIPINVAGDFVKNNPGMCANGINKYKDLTVSLYI